MSRHSHYKPFSVRRLEKKSKNRLFTTVIISGLLLFVLFFWLLPTLIGELTFLNKSKDSPLKDKSTQNDVIAPPVLNIPYEATSSSEIRVNGYAIPDSKVEVYFDDELKDTVTTHNDGTFTTKYIELSLGRNNIYSKTANEKGDKSLASKTIILIYDNEKPKLQIQEPSDGQTIQGGDKKVKIQGTTDPEVLAVTAQGNRLIVNSGGSFSQAISINEGGNEIVIIATDRAGNASTVTRKVTYTP